MADGTKSFTCVHTQFSSCDLHDCRVQWLFSEVRKIANKSYFEESNVDSFRQEFLKCLKNLVYLSSDSPLQIHDGKLKKSAEKNHRGGIVHYNVKLLEECLFPSQRDYALNSTSSRTGIIAWSEICQNYDDTYHHNLFAKSNSSASTSDQMRGEEIFEVSSHRYNTESKTTALEEILSIISHPSTFPPCFTSLITMTLIRVFSETQNDKKIALSVLHTSINGEIRQIENAMTPSSKLISSHLQSIILKRSNMLQLGKPFIHYIQHTIDIQHNQRMEFLNNDRNLTTVCNLISLSTLLLKNEIILALLNYSCWNIVMLFAIIKLVAKLDQLDMELLQSKEKKRKHSKRRNFVCHNCDYENSFNESLIQRKRQRRVQTSSLSDLHDTDGFNDKVSHNCNHGNNSALTVIWKKFESSQAYDYSGKKEFLCDNCFVILSRLVDANLAHARQKNLVRKRKANDMTLLSYDMCQLRSLLYQTILNNVTKIMPHKITHLLDIITENLSFYNNPSLRFSTLLIIHSGDKINGYLSLLRKLWKVFSERSNSDKFIFSKNELNYIQSALRAYSEVIIEVKEFDDTAACWKGLRPILDYVLSLKDDNSALQSEFFGEKDSFGKRSGDQIGSSEVVNEFTDKAKVNQTSKRMKISCQNYQKSRSLFFIKILLRYIIHILARRRHCFAPKTEKNESVVSEFNQYIIKLSLAFEDVNLWIDLCSCLQEKKRIISTLKVLGILSFFDTTSDGSEIESVIEDDSQETANENNDNWPFDGVSTLRSTIERAGPNEQYKMILANDSRKFICAVTSDSRKVHNKRKNEELIKESSICMEQINEEKSITKYIYSDTLRMVFSFLGYKLLSKISLVCREWNSVSREDLFWKEFYLRRFKSKFDIDHLPNGIHSNLRFRLMEHYTVQRGQWRYLFDSKWKQEKKIRFDYNKNGWKHRTCEFVGCLDILCSPEQLEKHEKEHQKSFSELMKKVKLRMQHVLNRKQGCVMEENKKKVFDLTQKFNEEMAQLELIQNLERQILRKNVDNQVAELFGKNGYVPIETNAEVKRKVTLFEKQLKNECLQLKRKHAKEMKILKRKNSEIMDILSQQKKLLRTTKCNVLCCKLKDGNTR